MKPDGEHSLNHLSLSKQPFKILLLLKISQAYDPLKEKKIIHFLLPQMHWCTCRKNESWVLKSLASTHLPTRSKVTPVNPLIWFDLDIYLVPAAKHTAGRTLKPPSITSLICVCVSLKCLFKTSKNLILQLLFSLHKGLKAMADLFAKRVNEFGELGWHHGFCFICFYRVHRPRVINKLADTELIFPAILKPENNDWSYIIS